MAAEWIVYDDRFTRPDKPNRVDASPVVSDSDRLYATAD